MFADAVRIDLFLEFLHRPAAECGLIEVFHLILRLHRRDLAVDAPRALGVAPLAGNLTADPDLLLVALRPLRLNDLAVLLAKALLANQQSVAYPPVDAPVCRLHLGEGLAPLLEGCVLS